MGQRRYRIIASAGVAAVFGAMLVAVAPAASAAEVTTFEALQQSLNDDAVTTLTADIDATGSLLTVAAGVRTLDLAGHALTVAAVSLAPSVELTITGQDPDPDAAVLGGRLSALGDGIAVPDGANLTISGGAVAAGSEWGAGIGGGSGGGAGGAVSISGGTVTATSFYGAGIGGGDGGAGGVVSISGGTVTATSQVSAGIGGGAERAGGVVSISGGTVTATSELGAGIGGGMFGAGGVVSITGGTVTATSNEFGSAIGRGADPVLGTSFGSLEIGPAGVLQLPEGATLLVPDGAQVVNQGTITGVPPVGAAPAGAGRIEQQTDGGTAGVVVNEGSITLPTANVVPADLSFVTGHNYPVRYMFITDPPPEPDRVFAASFEAGGRTLPPGTWIADLVSGVFATADTNLSELATGTDQEVTLYQAPLSLTVVPPSAQVAGQRALFFAYAVMPDATNQAVVPAYSVTPADGVVIDGLYITFPAPGTYTVVASWGGASASVDVAVSAPPADRVDVTYTPQDVVAGHAAEFMAQAFGGLVDLGDVTGQTTFTSSAPEDVVDGNRITFMSEGPRTVSAAHEGATGQVEVVVGEPVADGLSVGLAAGLRVGFYVEFGVFAYSGSYPMGDVTEQATYASSNPDDVVSGNRVFFMSEGDRTVTITYGDASHTTGSFHVYPAVADRLVMASAPDDVAAGHTAGFTVRAFSGVYDMGDVTGQTTFASSDPGDKVDGSRVTFMSAGPRTVTATYEGVTGQVELVVGDPVADALVVAADAVVVTGSRPVTFTAVALSGAAEMGDVSAATEFTARSVDGGTVLRGNPITFTRSGTYTVTGTYEGARGEVTGVVVIVVSLVPFEPPTPVVPEPPALVVPAAQPLAAAPASVPAAAPARASSSSLPATGANLAGLAVLAALLLGAGAAAMIGVRGRARRS